MAAQKFISDIATDALQHARVKAAKKRDRSSSSPTGKKLVLTTEELAAAAEAHGISVKKPRFFADSKKAARQAATLSAESKKSKS